MCKRLFSILLLAGFLIVMVETPAAMAPTSHKTVENPALAMTNAEAGNKTMSSETVGSSWSVVTESLAKKTNEVAAGFAATVGWNDAQNLAVYVKTDEAKKESGILANEKVVLSIPVTRLVMGYEEMTVDSGKCLAQTNSNSVALSKVNVNEASVDIPVNQCVVNVTPTLADTGVRWVVVEKTAADMAIDFTTWTTTNSELGISCQV